jgi:hypothetical protein
LFFDGSIEVVSKTAGESGRERRKRMHAAIRRYQVAGSVDEVIREINEGFLPIIKDASGFQAYYALDAGLGRLATVSVFDDQAGAEESSRMAADYIRQHENIASLLPNPPDVLQGEVGAHEEAASAGPVSAAKDTVGGFTDTVGGVTDSVRGVTGGLLGGGEKKR